MSTGEAELHIQRILESFGLPFSAATLYAHLLLRGEPATIAQLSTETGLGKSTVATALRILEQYNLVYYTKKGKTKLYHARSGLHQLLLFPTRMLREHIIPLRSILEQEQRREPKPHIERLLRDLKIFEQLAREVEELIERKALQAGMR